MLLVISQQFQQKPNTYAAIHIQMFLVFPLFVLDDILLDVFNTLFTI